MLSLKSLINVKIGLTNKSEQDSWYCLVKIEFVKLWNIKNAGLYIEYDHKSTGLKEITYICIYLSWIITHAYLKKKTEEVVYNDARWLISECVWFVAIVYQAKKRAIL